MVIKDDMEKDLSVYQVGWEACEKGHFFGPAIRDHYLIHYIVQGKGIYKVGDKEYRLEQGEGFLIRPEEITFYQADQEEPWVYYWLGFNGKYAESMLERCRLGGEQLTFSYKQDEELKYILHKLVHCTHEYNVNEYEQLGYVYLFFAILTKSKEHIPMPHHEYVNKAIKFIQYNYSYDITINQVAKHIGIERTYMFRLFKKILGISPQEYLVTVRLEKAREMLISSSMGITEIAYSCGFREIGYFSRAFKKNYNVSPSFYRKQVL